MKAKDLAGEMAFGFLILMVSIIPATPVAVACHPKAEATWKGESLAMAWKLLPSPQGIKWERGRRPLGPAVCRTAGAPSSTERIARDSLSRFLPSTGPPLPVRIGSVEEGYEPSWITASQRSFLNAATTGPEAYLLTITPEGITVVGKGRWGMLYGVQTVNQLAREAARRKQDVLPCLTIRDWPDLKWRCLAPVLTWYSGFNRLEGYDLCNWSRDEWKWLVDWSLLHKCNAWAVCMCGYWPFDLPGYPEAVLDVDSFFFNPQTGRKEPRRFVHPNIRSEFFPEVIRYAQERGIKVYAYTPINSFVGGYILHHPEANAGGAAELLPFHPGVHEYVDAFLGRMVEMGFDGFVWENPEAYHVPNQNEQCYQTFWEPWAKTYGFSSVEQTDPNAPPLGVHVEYLTWLFNEYNGSVQRHAQRLGLPPRQVYLISHFLLSRILAESGSLEEAREWLDLIDQKQGTKVPWIVAESREKDYVSLLGGERVASLGGRGGSCTCAMRRIASVNNNWEPGPMGTGVDWERDCQRRLFEAGGNGAMGYIFEWRLNEIFGYIAAQYLWRNAGVPGLNNEDQVGFLDYAYRVHYGDRVGALVARVLDEGSNVNEAMVMEGVYGSQYPHTGQPLHRDFQLLAAQADQALGLAWKAYRLFTGSEPNVEQPLYRSQDFRWTGYDPSADHLFKAETLRRLCVSTRRSQLMCQAALSHRRAMRLAAEGAPLRAVFEQLDRAVAAAEANQRLYQINYDDDYDWTDGLCVRVTERLKAVRDQFLAASGGGGEWVRSWTFDTPGQPLGWTQVYHLTPPEVAGGELRVEAAGEDPQIIFTESLAIPVTRRHFVELEMASDRSGMAELFWTDRPGDDSTKHDPFDFRQHPPFPFAVKAGGQPTLYYLTPAWEGTLTGLRLDTPDQAKVRLRSIRIGQLPEGRGRDALAQPAPGPLRQLADPVLFIPWEKQTDLGPAKRAARTPGLYLSLDLGLNALRDTYCQGVVFTVQIQADGKPWRPLFRRTLGKNSRGWEHWDIPLCNWKMEGRNRPPQVVRFRFLTDSYSRARDRGWPSWRWALWGQPQLVEITKEGARRVVFDFAERIDQARPFVRLDADGQDRPFDHPGKDSTGATFQKIEPGPLEALRQGEGRAWQWIEGFAQGLVGGNGPYPCFLGSVESWWRHTDPAYYQHPGERDGDVTWLTEPVPERRETAVGWVGGTSYSVAETELWVDGKRLIRFPTGTATDARWTEGNVELRYFFGGDTRDEKIPYGLSGLFLLRLPGTLIRPGQPLKLSAKMRAGAPDAWFMVHGCRQALRATKTAALPPPSRPSIAAFTPHRRGTFGVTGADYEVALRGSK